MFVSDEIGAPLIAAFLILVATQMGARLRESARRRLFARQAVARRQARAELRRKMRVAEGASVRHKGVAELVDCEHRAAVVDKKAYQSTILRLAICLGLAFTALALAVTLIDDHFFKLVLAYVDVFSLLLAFYY